MAGRLKATRRTVRLELSLNWRSASVRNSRQAEGRPYKRRKLVWRSGAGIAGEKIGEMVR
jgi:hypothetical protein